MSEFYFPKSLNTLPFPSLKIRHFSLLTYKPYMQGIWHQHAFGEILYVKSGIGYLHIGNHITTIAAETVCMIPSYTPHYIGADPSSELSYYSIGTYCGLPHPSEDPGYLENGWAVFHVKNTLNTDFDSAAAAYAGPSPEPDPPKTPFERFFCGSDCLVLEKMNPSGFLRAGFDLLHQLCVDMKKEPAKEEYELFQLTANSLLSWIYRLRQERTVCPIHPARIAIHEILSYISDHYDEDLQLPYLEHRYGISSAQLNRLFNKYCGLSPRNYIIYYRLYIAIRLLIQSDLPVADITRLVGYQNQSHFNKVFQQHVGCNPSEFRERYPDQLPDAPTFR